MAGASADPGPRDRRDEAAPDAPELGPRDRATPRLSRGLAISLLVLLGLAYRSLPFWDPGNRLIPRTEGWFFLASNTSPQLVYLIAGILLYRRRERLRSAAGAGGSRVGSLPLLVAGAGLFLWSQHVDATDLDLISLLLVSLGSAWYLFGPRFAGAMLLPVLFLAFAIPMPAVLTNQIVFPVQLIAAAHSAWLLHAMSIPVVQEGDVLYLADRTFEIIETCSGLRSMEVIAMLAVACIGFFPASRLHAVLLIVFAPAIAYLVNLARVLSLILNPSSDVAAMHSLQGAAVFLVGAVALFALDSLLRRLFPRAPDAALAPESRTPPAAPSADPNRRAIAVAAVLVTLLAASFWMPRWSGADDPSRRAINAPKQLAGFRARESLTLDRPFLWTVRYAAQIYRRYERRREAVDVFIGYDDRRSRTQSLISPKNAFPGRGWHVEQRRTLELEAGGPRVEAVLVRSGGTRVLSLYTYLGTRGTAEEIARAWLATDRSFLRREGGALVVRLSTDVATAAGGQARAEARLRRLLEALWPTLTALAQPI
ncbi:MAG: EpsI family protein [Deltaproteobacteria bacterium]|nr:MAG: EpsI family protein [Deltaproteobacteria bacterium]